MQTRTFNTADPFAVAVVKGWRGHHAHTWRHHSSHLNICGFYFRCSGTICENHESSHHVKISHYMVAFITNKVLKQHSQWHRLKEEVVICPFLEILPNQPFRSPCPVNSIWQSPYSYQRIICPFLELCQISHFVVHALLTAYDNLHLVTNVILWSITSVYTKESRCLVSISSNFCLDRWFLLCVNYSKWLSSTMDYWMPSFSDYACGHTQSNTSWYTPLSNKL